MPDSNDASALDAEVAAIGEVLKCLSDLSGPARERVIEYVMRALSIQIERAAPAPAAAAPQPAAPLPAPLPQTVATAINDIRSLRESKQPNSANQMAAVAAYYLSELAPDGERSEIIDSTQLDRLFRQAGYPLPQRIGMTLPNATQAGYFDSTGDTGKYRLNPVGYNLVVHGLPSGSDTQQRRKSPRKAAPRKATARKTPVAKASTVKKAAKKAAAKKA